MTKPGTARHARATHALLAHAADVAARIATIWMGIVIS
jgi:hypothetical protein